MTTPSVLEVATPEARAVYAAAALVLSAVDAGYPTLTAAQSREVAVFAVRYMSGQTVEAAL